MTYHQYHMARFPSHAPRTTVCLCRFTFFLSFFFFGSFTITCMFEGLEVRFRLPSIPRIHTFAGILYAHKLPFLLLPRCVRVRFFDSPFGFGTIAMSWLMAATVLYFYLLLLFGDASVHTYCCAPGPPHPACAI